MEKSILKSIIFILGACFGASSVALATDMTLQPGSKSHASPRHADPRTWAQVRNLHHGATELAVDARTWVQVRNLHHKTAAQQADARTWDQVRDIHHAAKAATADERTWYQVRHLHGKAKDGRILADN